MPFARKVRAYLIGCLAAASVSLVVMTVLAYFTFLKVISAVGNFSGDIAAMARLAVVTTLKDGDHDQKLEMIRLLREMGPAAAEFVPALKATLKDTDPDVRAEALEALKKIDFSAAIKATLW